jgi:hypothetical protein
LRADGTLLPRRTRDARQAEMADRKAQQKELKARVAEAKQGSKKK